MFDGKGNDERIDKSDAKFVDVIHTETSGQEVTQFNLIYQYTL